MALGDDRHEPTRRNWVSFWSLMGLQAQNAFNDKALQYTLLPLGVWLASGAAWGESFAHMLGLLMLAPFVFLAPVAGWISDHFSKTRVIRFAAWMQLLVLLVATASFGGRVLIVGVACLFFLSLQSTILSPSKLGIIKELVGSRRLGFASGVMEMFTILAILAGHIAVSFWFAARLGALGDGWKAGLWPMFVVSGGAVVTLVMAYSIEVVPPQGRVPFRKSIIFTHLRQLGYIFRSPHLRLSALGVAFFWVFGAILQLIAIQIARELYPAPDPRFASSQAWMMMGAGGGIAFGSIFAAMINRHHIELGLVPLGGIVMAVAPLLISLSTPESGFFYATIAAAGFGVAIFFVPVNAYLQDVCDPDQRGNVLAGSNLLNCLAMVLGVLIQWLMIQLRLTPQEQFLVIGLTAIPATWYVMRLLPRAFVKLLVMSGLRAIYRIKAIGVERMPKEGGVLLTPNHVSYLDALILTAASPRPVRFLMVRSYFRVPLVGKIAELFDTIPISSSAAKDAIRAASRALEEGSVVCIFPEGMLTRSGFLGEVKRGLELIARRADCGVQAVYLDGLWKSIFSAERGRFFWKLPRAIPFGVRVAFGEPRSPVEAGAKVVKRDLHALAGAVFARRRETARDLMTFLYRARAQGRALAWWQDGEVRSCNWSAVRRVLHGEAEPAEVARGHEGAAAWLAEWRSMAELSKHEVRSLVLNAHQLADPHDIGLGKSAVLIDSEAPLTVRRVWGMLLPVLVHSYAVSHGPADDAASFEGLLEGKVKLRDLVGTERMGELAGAGHRGSERLCCYRFGAGPQSKRDAEARIFACYETGNRVVSLSIAHTPKIWKRDVEQAGWMEGSYGRLLTGFVAKEEPGGLVLEGEMIEDRIELPGWSMDEKGFLWSAAEGEGRQGG